MTQNSAIKFSNAKFIKSCLEEKDYPVVHTKHHTPFLEVAVIGRSNAGKSSLINHLAQKKHLVHVSSFPGKTQTLNFFNIDDAFLLVDLPGYGFAKAQKKLRETWAAKLSSYLENRPQLQLLILLLDIRRDLSLEDKQMIEWGKFQNKQILFIFSKTDKLSQSERRTARKSLTDSIKEVLNEEEFPFISYSIKDKQCRVHLKQAISHFLNPLQD